MTTPPTQHTLLSGDLLPTIAQFQRGACEDMRPFYALRRPLSNLFDDSGLVHDAAMVSISVKLTPWIHTYGPARLRLLVACLPHMHDVVVLFAVYFGHLDLLPHLPLAMESNLPLLDIAAARGHVAMVQYLHSTYDKGVGCSTLAMDTAAAHGYLAIVRFLHFHRSEGCTHAAMDQAASHGYADVLAFLDAHRNEGASPMAMGLAATHGHLNALAYLHDAAVRRGDSRRWGTYVMDYAAIEGHLDVVQFLHLHRPADGCSVNALNGAATRGNLEMVRWLHMHRTEGCTTSAMDGAARFGHLHVLAFLHAHRNEGCTAEALKSAARHDHVDVVTWLLEKKRPVHDHVLDALRQSKHPQIMFKLRQALALTTR
ncbi:Aste57867_2021 [Aphanomyces stellatus]|uniref:Aste57867_2021 protein n=1 Tax=Aphanomyces stellatus TaxID=120398 RepID=A0A485K968_9STRA|nr:hypothetical protein As57867_002018 [Aphanomyces stellatus]VFT79225.1 Aste57867_2021 [Aphanomyces stellatus]